jgi:hypothetical protein
MTLSSQVSAGIVAKFCTAAGGCWLEQEPTPYGTIRAWRFDGKGRAEFCHLGDIGSHLERWYGHQYTEKDFILC